MRRTKFLAATTAIGLAVALTACSSTKTKSGSTGGTGGTSSAPGGASSTAADNGPKKPGGSITMINVTGQQWGCQFNPFNNSYNQESMGFIYEPLTFVDILDNAKETPMLAKSYTWGADKKSIVFHLQDGAKWSDGQPLTGDDVAFTFNLMKTNDALDNFSLWKGGVLDTVTASGNDVTMNFKVNAQTSFFSIASQIGIVPKHIWTGADVAGKEDTFADAKPIGSGPYTVSECTPNNIAYRANPNYWIPNKPSIQTVNYPAFLDNGPANNKLASGEGVWGEQYIPGLKSFYLDKDKNNHTWSPPITSVAIYPNLDKSHAKDTGNLAVRQAIELAIDKSQVAAIGEDGQQVASNQTGIILPTFQKYYDASAFGDTGEDKVNVDKAKQLLATAGYSPSSPLNLSIITVTGYTDWDASLAVIKQQLSKVGINLTIQDLAQDAYNDKLFKGDFQLAYFGPAGGPSPYNEFRLNLYGPNSADIGTAAGSNFSRYHNADVDKLIDDYATADATGQTDIIKKISTYMVKDLPVIPITESVDWFQYNDTDIKGWPNADNPYAQPGINNIPDVEQVLLHLYSAAAQK